jgi:uncharacterized membrane protein
MEQKTYLKNGGLIALGVIILIFFIFNPINTKPVILNAESTEVVLSNQLPVANTVSKQSTNTYNATYNNFETSLDYIETMILIFGVIAFVLMVWNILTKNYRKKDDEYF